MNHLTNAFNGKNQWWRYLLLFIASMFGGQIIGGIPLFVIIIFKTFQSGEIIQPNSDNMSDLSAFGIDPNLGLFLLMLPFIFCLFILILLYKPLHRQSYKVMISGIQKIRWSRIIISALIWIIFSGIYLYIDYSINPINYVLNFNARPFIILCLISLILIPFQASYEEFIFRGYLTQGFAVWTKNRILVILIPSILFGLMHSFNPEINAYGFWMMMPQYIGFGLIFGLISVLDDGIELAIGGHTANNIFLSVFVTSKSSVLQTPALLVQQEINPLKEMILLFGLGILFVGALSFIYKWDYRILRKKIEPTA
jgi:membrane protease YdiL (CAAX protease family)